MPEYTPDRIKPIFKKILIVLISGSAFLSNASQADHGRDFLLVQSPRIGETGDVFGIARQDYTREKNSKGISFEPLLSWTARSWLSLEINSDAEKMHNEAFDYQSTLAGLRLRFTPKNSATALGLAARYEIASSNNDNNALKLSALSTYQVDDWLFGANINYEKAENTRREWRYAAGIKHELQHHLGMGIEIAGDLENEKSGEIVAGIFAELTHQFQMNAGIGTGFNNDVKLTVKTALIWRF